MKKREWENKSNCLKMSEREPWQRNYDEEAAEEEVDEAVGPPTYNHFAVQLLTKPPRTTKRKKMPFFLPSK